jgi:hypothetical protein
MKAEKNSDGDQGGNETADLVGPREPSILEMFSWSMLQGGICGAIMAGFLLTAGLLEAAIGSSSGGSLADFLAGALGVGIVIAGLLSPTLFLAYLMKPEQFRSSKMLEPRSEVGSSGTHELE